MKNLVIASMQFPPTTVSAPRIRRCDELSKRTGESIEFAKIYGYLSATRTPALL